MSEPTKRRALGRGLSALLPSNEKADGKKTAPLASSVPQPERSYFNAPIEEIHPNPEQPRKRFGDDELDELAQSIRAHGVIQPLIVRPRAKGGFYLIAGERRWRASQRAGRHDVPVVVQKVADQEAFERALVENIQRADLNAIETAEAYARLIDDYDYTQDQVAERVGKDRSSVANSLRLLKLPEKVRAMVEEDTLSMGHARALLALDSVGDIEATARTVVAQGLSVRATEKLVRQKAGGGSGKKAAGKKKSPAVKDLENRLTQSLGAPVAVKDTGKGGTVEIRYSDLDDLDRLLELLL